MGLELRELYMDEFINPHNSSGRWDTVGHPLTVLDLVKKPSPKPIFLDPSAGCGSLPEIALCCRTLHVAVALLHLCSPSWELHHLSHFLCPPDKCVVGSLGLPSSCPSHFMPFPWGNCRPRASPSPCVPEGEARAAPLGAMLRT